MKEKTYARDILHPRLENGKLDRMRDGDLILEEFAFTDRVPGALLPFHQDTQIPSRREGAHEWEQRLLLKLKSWSHNRGGKGIS